MSILNEEQIKLIKNKCNELSIDMTDVKRKLDLFKNLYGKEMLSKLEGKELLYHLFARKVMNDKSLFYALEFHSDFREFGGVAGGSNYKYSLFYSLEQQSWISGTHSRNARLITESEAIEKATEVRNKFIELIDYLDEVSKLEFGEIDYSVVEKKLSEILENYHLLLWINKYITMLYPNLFIGFYNITYTKEALNKLNVDPQKSYYRQNGQLVSIAKEIGISVVELHRTLFYMFFNNKEFQVISEETSEVSLKAGQNLIIYGTPGCGKSYYVKNEILLGRTDKVIRTTFHQDYTNTDFVGQILPVVEGDKVTYEFIPGPFTLALNEALSNSRDDVSLIIEELNRGNAASIFGDIFQLLDRNDNGESEYSITNINIQKYLSKQLNKEVSNIIIPSNLSILATMNTSDQNVFTLDTAFKRRWNFKKLKNIFNDDHDYKDLNVPGMDISWEFFVNKINKYIVLDSSIIQSEDKQLGVYFVDKKTIDTNNNDNKSKFIEDFAHKVLEYLWNDVAKFNRSRWFNNVKTLDELIDLYISKGEQNKAIEVFSNDIFN